MKIMHIKYELSLPSQIHQGPAEARPAPSPEPRAPSAEPRAPSRAAVRRRPAVALQ